MNTLTFAKNEIIFKEGSYPDCMYDIVSGSVGVYVRYGMEGETRLTVLGAGQFLGEMGVIEMYPRSATAVAMEEGTQLRRIEAQEFSDFFQGQPERLLAIMRQLSERLRDRTADYEGALQVLNSLKETQKQPEKRSRSLLERAQKFIDFYNSMMSFAAQDPDMSASYYFPFSSHRF